MQWSQLKKRIEGNFADSVKGRLEVWSTRYRAAVHQYGESWVTIDGRKITTMGTLRFEVDFWVTVRRLRKEREGADCRDPAKLAAYRVAHDDATQILHDDGVFASWDLNRSLFAYLNLGIEDALASENPIIRAFAVLDRRCGKRRLADFGEAEVHPLVSQFHRFRCTAEGMHPRQYPADSDSTLHADAGVASHTDRT